MPAFKYCVLQWSFSEMLDSPTQNCSLLPYISESLPQQKKSWDFFPRNSPATNVSQIVSWQLPLATYPPHATIQNLRNMNCLVISSISDGGPRKVNDLLTSPSNQFRDYSIWNRIEKSVPQHWNFAPRTLQTIQQADQPVFKP